MMSESEHINKRRRVTKKPEKSPDVVPLCETSQANIAVVTAIFKNSGLVTSVNFDWNQIGNKGIRALVAILEKNTTMKVSLEATNIGTDGAKVLSEIFENNTTVTSVNLCHNNIRDTGASAIAAALEKNTTVTSVDLSENNIGNKGTMAIAAMLKKNTTVTRVHLNSNMISYKGVSAIADAFEKNTTVAGLSLFGNRIGDWGIRSLATMLEKNTAIRNINLSDNFFGHNGVHSITDALQKNTTVTNLALYSGRDTLYLVPMLQGDTAVTSVFSCNNKKRNTAIRNRNIDSDTRINRNRLLVIGTLIMRNRIIERLRRLVECGFALGIRSLPRILRFRRNKLSKVDEKYIEAPSESTIIDVFKNNKLFATDVSLLVLSYLDRDFDYRNGSAGRVLH